MDVSVADRWALDRTVYVPGQRAGHYESFYQRGNHPDRPLAFWLRYTIFAPQGRPADAIGELWAVVFDGETQQHSVGKLEVPIARCSFDRDRFAVRVDDARLGPDGLRGAAGDIGWDLSYCGEADPVLLLPPRLYRGGFPRAKSLVPLPLARFTGTLTVGDRAVEVADWLGSQNHNWGTQHTDRYAFAQVAGFDGAPESFLEVATAKARIAGPLRTPWTTFLVLRHGGREYRCTSLRQALRATGSYRWFEWEFTTGDDAVAVTGRVHAPREAFVALRYGNPPGGAKQCVNTKIATVELTVTDRRTGAAQRLHATDRALFEILTDGADHGLPLRA